MDVNKRELASILGWSLPKLDQWLTRHAGRFPVIEAGGHGRGYRFDPEAVAAFVQSIEAERRKNKADRDGVVAQLALPGLRAASRQAFGRQQIDWLNGAIETMRGRIATAIRRRCAGGEIDEETILAIEGDCDAAFETCLHDLVELMDVPV